MKIIKYIGMGQPCSLQLDAYIRIPEEYNTNPYRPPVVRQIPTIYHVPSICLSAAELLPDEQYHVGMFQRTSYHPTTWNQR